MSNKAETGAKGEQLATDYLNDNGYDVVERNYRHKHAEIDIIAKYKELLVFVEVKTRSKTVFGFPEEAVNERKASKVIEGAEHYVLENEWNGDIRFDIVSIVLSKKIEIQHFEDAF
jgi:putative endonuclease